MVLRLFAVFSGLLLGLAFGYLSENGRIVPHWSAPAPFHKF